MIEKEWDLGQKFGDGVRRIKKSIGAKNLDIFFYSKKFNSID